MNSNDEFSAWKLEPEPSPYPSSIGFPGAPLHPNAGPYPGAGGIGGNAGPYAGAGGMGGNAGPYPGASGMGGNAGPYPGGGVMGGNAGPYPGGGGMGGNAGPYPGAGGMGGNAGPYPSAGGMGDNAGPYPGGGGMAYPAGPGPAFGTGNQGFGYPNTAPPMNSYGGPAQGAYGQTPQAPYGAPQRPEPPQSFYNQPQQPQQPQRPPPPPQQYPGGGGMQAPGGPYNPNAPGTQAPYHMDLPSDLMNAFAKTNLDSPHAATPGTSLRGADQFVSGSVTATAAAQKDIYCPTLKPFARFDATNDCERLRKAMKGMGTDEKAIIDVMGHRSADQRVKIVLQFKTMYGKDLVKEFKSELSGHFYECVEALCYSPVELDVMQLRKAVKGAGTDEDALIEIVCSRTNEQIRQIKEAYARIFPGRNLEKDVISDTSKHFRRIMVSLLQANRDESLIVDHNAARRDAEALYKAGEKKMGTDESRFNVILASRSFFHLRAVFTEYKHFSKKSIEQVLKSEMSGDLLKSMLAIVRCIENKQLYFAHQLMKSMKGLGTNDRTLIRLVVTRCEIDMVKIKEEFQRANGKSLESWITDDTTGDYRKLLLALITV